jgi:NADP-dependent alcohol dehydrogenase
MLNFELYNPTNLVFGRANRKTRRSCTKGAKILLAYGGSIFKNGIHEQVINNLKGHEIVDFQVLKLIHILRL